MVDNAIKEQFGAVLRGAAPTTNPDLVRAFEALKRKKLRYKTLYQYYDGDQPLTYTNARLKEIFDRLDARFTQNWTKVVVDSVKDRVKVKGFTYPDKAIQTALDDLFMSGSWEIEFEEAIEGALVTGESFVFIWQNIEGEPPDLFTNDPSLFEVFYRDDNPKEVSFAAKWFVNGDPKKTLSLYLYYPDRIEYYKSSKPAEEVQSVRGLQLFIPEGASGPVVENPTGRVPVFHLRLNRRGLNELDNIIPVQNGINKLLADMLVAAEFGAFKQRYVISNADTEGKLKNAPNEVWSIPAGDGVGQGTTVGEFAETNLDNFLKAIDNLSHSISAISRTPKHYFFSESGGDPSGEALITMESPLVKKARSYITRFTPVFREAAIFALALAAPSLEVDPRKLQVTWDNPETMQPKTTADITKVRVDSQIPLEIALKWEGRTEAEVAEVLKAVKAKKEQESADLATTLTNSMRSFDQNRARVNPDGSPVVDNNNPVPPAPAQGAKAE